MRTFVHLSDLHFGRTDARLTYALLEELHCLKPDMVIVSGDLTQTAARHEFREAMRFLKSVPGAPFVVPGNHDLPGWNVVSRFMRRFARYRRYIGPDMNPVYTDENLALVGLNTARTVVYHWNWSHGRVSRRQMAAVGRSFRSASESALRAVIMHHPIVPPSHKPGQKLVGRARLAAQSFSEAGTDIVLTGHLHQVTVADLRKTYPEIGRAIQSFQAGTTLSNRLRGEPNNFRMFHWSAPRLRTDQFEWTGRRFEQTAARHYVRGPAGLEEETVGG